MKSYVIIYKIQTRFTFKLTSSQ